MAKNWHDKYDIEERFGWSFRQFKTRLSYLDLVISSHYQGGNGQAYKVDDDGLTILDRQHQLEREGRGVKEAARTIIRELNNIEGKSIPENVKVSEGNKKVLIDQLKERIKEKDERIKELREDKKRLQEKNDALEQRLLTGEVEKEENLYKKKSLWQVIREWLQAPAA